MYCIVSTFQRIFKIKLFGQQYNRINLLDLPKWNIVKKLQRYDKASIPIFFFFIIQSKLQNWSVWFKFKFVYVVLNRTKRNKTKQIYLWTRNLSFREKTQLHTMYLMELRIVNTRYVFNDFIIVIYIFIISIYLQICLHNDFDFIYIS